MVPIYFFQDYVDLSPKNFKPEARRKDICNSKILNINRNPPLKVIETDIIFIKNQDKSSCFPNISNQETSSEESTVILHPSTDFSSHSSDYKANEE